MGTFVEGLKPWLSSEIKLRQSRSVPEVMKMVDLIKESSSERKKAKEINFTSSKGAPDTHQGKENKMEGSSKAKEE